ncbi:MAG: hypothetical protein QXW79_03595 [Thermoplasmata archaeon]
MWYSINRKWNFDGSLKFKLLDGVKCLYGLFLWKKLEYLNVD